MNPTHEVFVSYSHHDKPIADAVVAWLESASLRCWAAPRDVVPGADWGGAIIDAIKGAKLMVVVFSQHSNASNQVLREVERAVNRGIPIIPFKIDAAAPSGSMEYFLSTPHWLDAVNPPMEVHLGQLRETALHLVRAEKPPTPLPLPVPVPLWRRYLWVAAIFGVVALSYGAWIAYGLTLPVDRAVAGTWRAQDRMMPGTSTGTDDEMRISTDGRFTRTSRFRISGGYRRTGNASFVTSDEYIKGTMQNGLLVTPTCCFIVNTLPNYAFTLTTANTTSRPEWEKELTWQPLDGNGGQRWTSTWSTYGIPWKLTLLLSAENRYQFDAQADVEASVKAKGSVFSVTSRQGVTETGTFELRGPNILVLGGKNYGAWVRAQ